MRSLSYARDRRGTEIKMGVVIFIVLTVAVFAVLGLTQELVERL
jgi:hypothetical protein